MINDWQTYFFAAVETWNSNCTILWKVIVNFLYQIKFRMCQNRIEFWIKTVHNLYINNTWCKIGIIFMVLFLFEFLIRVWEKILSSSNTKVSQRRSNYLSINENLFVNQIMMVFVCYINSHYNTFHEKCRMSIICSYQFHKHLKIDGEKYCAMKNGCWKKPKLLI